MTALYIAFMPEASHAEIRQYFVAELPDAPPELFFALN
jgi:hypothetical protein